MQPRVSIALATYNGEKYLSEQLDSFLHQSLLPDEIVVCDDASSDGTLKILEAFKQKAPFSVKIFRNDTNLGYVRNFEKALTLCKGNVIFLSDQDDVWFHDKIEVLVNHLSENLGCHLLHCDMQITNHQLIPSGFTQSDQLKWASAQENGCFGCATCIRREFLKLALPFPSINLGHDGWLHSLAKTAGVRHFIKRPLQFYRRHGENHSNIAASSSQRKSVFQGILAHGLADVTLEWRDAINFIEINLQRLDQRGARIGAMGLTTRVAESRQDALTEIELRQQRINLMSKPRVLRTLRILRLWHVGGYQHFAGWKSVLKDMVRP